MSFAVPQGGRPVELPRLLDLRGRHALDSLVIAAFAFTCHVNEIYPCPRLFMVKVAMLVGDHSLRYRGETHYTRGHTPHSCWTPSAREQRGRAGGSSTGGDPEVGWLGSRLSWVISSSYQNVMAGPATSLYNSASSFTCSPATVGARSCRGTRSRRPT